MLTLARRLGETILYILPDGREIRLTVTRIEGTQVKITTQAPADITILREEIADRYRPQLEK